PGDPAGARGPARFSRPAKLLPTRVPPGPWPRDRLATESPPPPRPGSAAVPGASPPERPRPPPPPPPHPPPLAPAPDVSAYALLVDEEGRALDPHVLAAIHALLDPGAIGLADLALGIGGEGEGQLVFLLELIVAGDTVAAEADDDGIAAGEAGKAVAEAAGL